MKPTFFANQLYFRKWLQKNHESEKEFLVGFYKVHSSKPSMTWSQSVDQALCFGWIDGIRKSIDNNSYCIRFTPRKPKSIWSAVNIRKVEELTKQGLIQPAGLAAFEKREEIKSEIYSYEKEPVKLDEQFQRKFKTNKKAWAFFHLQSPSYQKQATHWVMNAKQVATKTNRLQKLIAASEAERKI